MEITRTPQKKQHTPAKNPFKEFLRFPPDAIRYMAMHWLGGGFLIYETILPAFMNMQGISILEAGILFSLASAVDVILTWFFSRFFDRISPNIGMALDWLTESIPPLIYGFATTMGHFLIGRIAGRMTNVLNPVYKIYENEIYPEEQRSLLYSYHMITPHLFTILFYPVIGYLLACVFPTRMAFQVVFWTCGLAYLLIAWIPLKGLRRVEPVRLAKSPTHTTEHFSRELYLAGAAEVMFCVGGGLTSTLITGYYILQKMHGNVLHLILLEVFGAVIGLITGLFSKDLGSRMPEEKGAICGVLLMAVYSALLIFSQNYAMILLAFLFSAMGETVWFPYHQALIMRRIPVAKRGLFFGKLYSVMKLVSMLLPFVSAFLASRVGFFMPYAMGFGSFLSVCVIYRVLGKERETAAL